MTAYPFAPALEIATAPGKTHSLTHPAAERAVSDYLDTPDQTSRRNINAIVGVLVMVEAMKALREMAGAPE
jgi:hypothetical protein